MMESLYLEKKMLEKLKIGDIFRINGFEIKYLGKSEYIGKYKIQILGMDDGEKSEIDVCEEILAAFCQIAL